MGVGVTGRAAVSFLALLGLGASIGAAGGGLEIGARSLGVVIAAVSAVSLARRSVRTGWQSRAALWVMPAAIGSVGQPGLDTALYVGSLAVLIYAVPEVLAEVGACLALVGNGARAPGIDVIGRTELSRARRIDVPVTVASIALQGRYTSQELGRAAAELRDLLRETDQVGYAGRDELLALFVGTPESEAHRAWRRLRAAISPGIALRLRAGFAAFPDDNPTWEGTRVLARRRAQNGVVGQPECLIPREATAESPSASEL